MFFLLRLIVSEVEEFIVGIFIFKEFYCCWNFITVQFFWNFIVVIFLIFIGHFELHFVVKESKVGFLIKKWLIFVLVVK